MTTAALTPQERQALNAWIAEHVFGWQWHEESDYLARRLLPPGYNPICTGPQIPDYAGDWAYAGPLFDRYDEWYLISSGGIYRVETLSSEPDGVTSIVTIATGTTGPEAIAKACKAWEEVKDDNRCKHEHINEYHECVMCGEVQ